MEISARSALLAALAVVALAFTVFAWAHLRRVRASAPTPWMVAVGFVTNFFDTLGIGSYATTTTLWRARGTVDDRLLPGTLNVGHAWPTFAQAAIFLVSVRVGEGTLVALVGAAVVGAWLGAGVAARLSKRRVRLAVGTGLAAAAGLMAAGLLGALPVGGAALALDGVRLAIGAAACACFGALMTFGVGAYAPIMITVALLGMNPTAAFPIMMGACAFLMPAANVRFLQAGACDPRAALGLTLGGVPGVLVAAWVVRSLPTTVLKVLVIAVAAHAAQRLFADAREAEPEA
jgi:uncharacterized membrane protein YfcA